MWEKERKNHRIETYNLRATNHNELEVMVCEHLKEKKALRQQIKSLQTTGQSDVDQKQIDDLQQTITRLESDLASARLEISGINEEKRAADTLLENVKQ